MDSIGHSFAVSTRSENLIRTDLYRFALHEISGLTESIFGHLRCFAEDVLPLPNSPSEIVPACDLLKIHICKMSQTLVQK